MIRVHLGFGNLSLKSLWAENLRFMLVCICHTSIFISIYIFISALTTWIAHKKERWRDVGRWRNKTAFRKKRSQKSFSSKNFFQNSLSSGGLTQLKICILKFCNPGCLLKVCQKDWKGNLSILSEDCPTQEEF